VIILEYLFWQFLISDKMGDAGFFRGTSAEQDNRFSDKEKKLMKQMRFAESLSKKVDMKKVKLESIKPWIGQRVSELLGMEDDVLNEFVINQLEDKNPDGKRIQINLTGFLNGKNARIFTGELWDMLISAQESPTGIPASILEAKKVEIQKRTDESEELRLRKVKLEAELSEREKDTSKDKETRPVDRPPRRRSPTPEKPIPQRSSRRSRSRSPDRRQMRRSPPRDRERVSRFSRRSPSPDRRRRSRSRTPERSRRRSPVPERSGGSRRRSPSPPEDRPHSSTKSRKRSEDSGSDADGAAKEKGSDGGSDEESKKRKKKNKKHKKHKKDRKNDKDRDSGAESGDEGESDDGGKKKKHKSDNEESDEGSNGRIVLDAEAEMLERKLRERALESLKAQKAAAAAGQGEQE